MNHLIIRQEGAVRFYVPDPEKYGGIYSAPVFYNSRATSLHILKQSWQKPLHLLDPFYTFILLAAFLMLALVAPATSASLFGLKC